MSNQDQDAAARQTAPGTETPRQELVQAVVAALPVLLRGWIQDRPGPNPQVRDPSDPVDFRKAVATYLGKTPEEVSDEEVQDAVMQIERHAENSADSLGRFLEGYVAHLEDIGCPAGSVENYVRLERQTLASLYYLVQRTAPSPTEMRRLALRAALDARSPVEGNLSRFESERTPGGWVISEHPGTVPILPRPYRHRVVRNALLNKVLDCILSDSPKIFELMRVIETIFGEPPHKAETLEAAACPTFSFAVGEAAKRPDVRLWVNELAIRLPGRADVHKLLKVLCLNPGVKFTGAMLRRDHGITNPSLAARLARAALERVYPDAGRWLLTNPHVCWAEGHHPTAQAFGKGEGQ